MFFHFVSSAHAFMPHFPSLHGFPFFFFFQFRKVTGKKKSPLTPYLLIDMFQKKKSLFILKIEIILVEQISNFKLYEDATALQNPTSFICFAFCLLFDYRNSGSLYSVVYRWLKHHDSILTFK